MNHSQKVQSLGDINTTTGCLQAQDFRRLNDIEGCFEELQNDLAVDLCESKTFARRSDHVTDLVTETTVVRQSVKTNKIHELSPETIPAQPVPKSFLNDSEAQHESRAGEFTIKTLLWKLERHFLIRVTLISRTRFKQHESSRSASQGTTNRKLCSIG